MAELFERLRQPAVVGEILAGVLLGPSLLNFINPAVSAGAAGGIGVIIEALAEIGIAGCGSPALKLGKRRAIQVGVGRIPRGEVV